MEKELQNKINRAVALRNEAFHECLNAIREVLKANDGFLNLHRDGRRATVRALVWSEQNQEYIDQDIHAVRLNGKDDNGEDIVEMFADSFICDFTREEMESVNHQRSWHPVSVDSESIYPMAPVFELAYWIDDFVAENLPKGYQEAAHKIVCELIDGHLIESEPEGIDWEITIAKILKKMLGGKTATRKPVSRVYVLRNELIPESFAEDTEEEIKKFLGLQEAYLEDKEGIQDKFTGMYTLDEFERLVNECGDDSLCPDAYSIRIFTDGEPSPSGNELADIQRDYIDRLVEVIEPFVPCKVEVDHENTGVLSGNKACYSIEKTGGGALLFTDLETMISFTAADAVDGELYAIAEKLTHKD